MIQDSQKPSFKERFHYWFEWQMEKGMRTRIGMLICASLVIIIVFSIAGMWLDPQSSFLSTFWKLLMRTFDPGNMADDPPYEPALL